MSRIVDARERTRRWLIGLRNPDGGWPSQVGYPSSILNTSEVLLSLLDRNSDDEDYIEGGLDFLRRHQTKEGSDKGSWPRCKESSGRQAPDIIRTTFAVRALVRANRADDKDSIRSALDWLLSVRNADNGWGFRRGKGSRMVPTCFCVFALLEAHERRVKSYENEIVHAIEYMKRYYQSDKEGSKLVAYFNTEGKLEAAHSILGAMVFHGAVANRIRNYQEYQENLERVVRWLLKNPDVAMKPVEEIYPVDPEDAVRGEQKPELDYGYLYMTDALMLQVLSTTPEGQQSQLLEEALQRVGESMDRVDGGVYGSHKFSWAASKVLTGLSRLSADKISFPVRPPEEFGARRHRWLLAAMFVVMLIAMVALTYVGQFGKWHAILLAVVMLFLYLAEGGKLPTEITEIFSRRFGG